ncbi:hypothetical protein BV286_01135, partial [Lactiplantibacillus plantarum]
GKHPRHYRVKPEQNLDTNQIQQLYQQNNLDDIND